MEPVGCGKIYYGWYIVAVALLGHFMASGISFYVFNAFLKPLSEARGWSRTEINVAPLVGYPVALLGTLVMGTLVKRVGPRTLMAAGAFVGSVSFMFLGLTQDVLVFYVLFAMVTLGAQGFSGVVANTAVSNWFVLKRGRALGLASVGISLAGVVFPLIAMLIIARTGLANAFFWTGLLAMMLVPISWMVVRTRPEEYGWMPDGGAEPAEAERQGFDSGAGNTQAGSAHRVENQELWGFFDLVRTPAFWKLGMAYAMGAMCVGSVMFQLAPRFSDVGFEEGMSLFMMSATALMGAAGKYVWGALCDRFDPRRVVSVHMTATGLSLGLALLPPSPVAVCLFIVVFGFSMGGLMSTHAVITADLFGRESFPIVFKYLLLFFVIEVIGFPIMGQSYDLTGSYDTAYGFFVILNIVAAALILSIRRPHLTT